MRALNSLFSQKSTTPADQGNDRAGQSLLDHKVSSKSVAKPPKEENATWSDHFARINDTTQNLIDAPTALDNIQTDRPAPTSNAPNPYGPGGHMLAVPRPLSIDEPVQVDSASDTGEQTPEQRAEELSTQGHTDEEVVQILADINILKEGTEEEQVQAIFSLAQSLQPDEIGALAKELGIDDQAIVKLLTDTKAIAAVSTLVSGDASESDVSIAVITLLESSGDLAFGSLENALKKPLALLSPSQELIKVIDTFRNPDATNLEKGEAVLALVVSAKGALSTFSETLGQQARRSDSLFSTISAAITVLDKDASFDDRLKAAADLFANAPNVRGDLGTLSQRAVDQVLGKYTDIAFDLPEDIANSLNGRAVGTLTPEQVFRINSLNEELLTEGADNVVAQVLARAESPDSIEALLDALDSQADKAGKTALAQTLSELKPGALDDLLKLDVGGKNGAVALGETLAKLDTEGQAALKKVITEFDADSIRFLLRIGGDVDAGVLGQFLKAADALPSDKLGQAFKYVDAVLLKAGVEITGDIATRLLTNFTKLIPAIGAVPAAYDAVRLAEIAADKNLPADIRFLASSGAKINGVDVATSIVSALTAWTGVSIGVDIGIGVSALVVDLIVTDQLTKFNEAQEAGVEYTAPAWLTTVNVASAGAQGPAGWAEYWRTYGADGGIEALGIAAETGGVAAIHAAEGILSFAAEGIGEQLELTADGLHLLADIIRNPDVYGDKAVEFGQQAAEQLNELAEGVGDVAKAAAQELENLVGDLKQLGQDGIEALGWIASNPGEAAQLAVEAIGGIASDAIELGTDAAKAVAREALEKLDELASLGSVAAEHIEQAITDVTNKAIDLGEQGIEALGWIAQNPGTAADIARRALVDVAAQGGELAQAAYTQIVNLGDAGVELAEEVVGKLVELGADGINALGFIVTHPGEAADLAVEGLKNIASGIGDAAERAGAELVDLAEAGIESAKEVVSALLLEGGEAITNVVTALGENIGPGLISVLNGLADLGDAGRDALKGLADAGFDFALDGLTGAAEAIADLGDWAWNKTGSRILDFFR